MDMSEIPELNTPAARKGHAARTLELMRDTLSELRTYFDDEEVNEIMINGPHDVFVGRKGKEFKVNVNLSQAKISSAISLIASMSDREVGKAAGQPLLSARLPGFRVEAILPPAAVKGPSMCIRRHSARVFSIEEYIKSGVLSEKYAGYMKQCIDEHGNFLIVGGTGSGKTTLMNGFLGLIPAEERLFVIETVHELKITAPNSVLVECDEDKGVTPRKAVKAAMRYAPKRVIVGELRGAEAYDWMDAANTGHPGSGATIHANGAAKSLGRLENLLLMADMGVPLAPLRANIGESLQWMFYIQREGNVRRVSEVCRLHGYDRSKDAYDFEML